MGTRRRAKQLVGQTLLSAVFRQTLLSVLLRQTGVSVLLRQTGVSVLLRQTRVSVLLLLVCSPLFAQHFARDARAYFDYGDQLYVATRQSADADSIRVYVNTANALFSFLKSDKSLSARGSFYAIRDIGIEVRESPAGKVLASKNVRDTLFTSEFSETTSKETWRPKVISISIAGIKAPQTVDVHTEVRDGFLSRLSERPTNETIQLRSFSNHRSLTGRDSSIIGMGDPILFDASIGGRPNAWLGWGNTTEFSHDLSGVIPITLPIGEKIDSIVMTLTQVSDPFQVKGFTSRKIGITKILSEDIVGGKQMQLSSIDSVVAFSQVESTDSSVRHFIAFFHIPGDTLAQGDYEIVIKACSGIESRTIKQVLTLEWHDMPLSLENPRDAIPPLQYLTTEDEYDDLASGSRDEMLRKLYAFWKKQDPTPATAYNERMAEFYRRADYAYFNFARNVRQLDGAMTDRGKVYILFGAPTNIQRSFLLGEQPVEMWSYSNNVKKLFKFVDPSSKGDYKLIEVKPL
jgi:GWxTD domain-containing protein